MGETKLTKRAGELLRYLAGEHTGGMCTLSGMRDLEAGDRLIQMGFGRFYEARPGHYTLHITEAGREALRKTS